MDYAGPYQEPAWQAALDGIAPPGGRLSWLRLTWVAGDPWQPIGRWCIYQMLPIDRVNALVRESLLGPSPRVRGRYDEVLGRFIPDLDCNVDLIQWQLFQKTRCYGRPYWVVQGTEGGHKKLFNRAERAVCRMNNAPDEPPAIGDLPYAAPDQRTFDKLLKHDLARSYSYLLDRVSGSQEVFDMHEQQVIDGVRGQLWKWLASQVRGALSEDPAAARTIQENASAVPFDEAKFEADHN